MAGQSEAVNGNCAAELLTGAPVGDLQSTLLTVPSKHSNSDLAELNSVPYSLIEVILCKISSAWQTNKHPALASRVPCLAAVAGITPGNLDNTCRVRYRHKERWDQGRGLRWMRGREGRALKGEDLGEHG